MPTHARVKRITVFIGSGQPMEHALRYGISTLENLLGGTVSIIGERGYSDVILGESLGVYANFKHALATSDAVFLASGGSGSARVMHHVKAGDFDTEHTAIVCGSSDAFVYPFVTWLLSGSKTCFYGPNVDDADAIAMALHGIESCLSRSKYRSSIHDSVSATCEDFIDEEYTVVPACAGVLRQLTGVVRKKFISWLTKNRCLLVLEDAYPEGMALAVYEDITMLYDVFHAMQVCGGAVLFGKLPSPGEALAFPVSDFSIPFLFNLQFGHGVWSIPVIRFGDTWRVSYSAKKGLTITR